MFCGNGHLGFLINPKNVNCVDDHIWNKNPAKFSVKNFSDFDEDKNVKSQRMTDTKWWKYLVWIWVMRDKKLMLPPMFRNLSLLLHKNLSKEINIEHTKVSEWLFFKDNEQFFSYIMAKESFQQDDVLFV